LTGLENSVIVTSGSLALGFLAGVPLAYIFARFNFWNREGFKFMVASLRFIPPVVLVVPFLNIWLSTGLYDTQVSLIITYFTITAATMIWLCIEVFNSVEMHLEEAASIDGCSPFQVFYKVALPIALPGVLAMLIFTFILVWNEFFMAFILTLTRAFTLPVAVTTSIGYGPWGYISAMIVLLSIPPVLFSYVIMRFLPYYYRT
jgi:multiple sugar transport system permease protein